MRGAVGTGTAGVTRRRRRATTSLALVAALVTAGCTGGTRNGPPTPSHSPDANSPIVVNALEFHRSLLPADAQGYGARIAGLLFRGLVTYDLKGKAVNEVAESIETTDDRVYAIRLEEGWRFSDGEPVRAQSFVDAWNLARNPARGYRHAALFDPIAGLTVVDDRTFTLTLDAPRPGFPDRLGHVAFAPLPARAVSDPAAFAQAPVGNGPYALDGDWRSGTQVVLRPSGTYVGAEPARNAGIVFRVYRDLTQARSDLDAGRLDVLDEMPVADLPTYRDEYAQRAVNQPVGRAASLVMPLGQDPWRGSRGLALRTAISQAIDRAAITESVFARTREPATDLAAPVVEGHSRSLCGQLCRHDPAAAQDTLTDAGGLPAGLTIAYAADEGQARWADAICDDVTEALAVPCRPRSYPTRPALDAAIGSGAETGPFLVTHVMAYASLESFLVPRFTPGARGNDSGYSDEEAGDALVEAARTPRAQQASAYVQAESLVLADLPVVPLWSANATGAVGPGIDGALTDVFGAPRYAQIRRR